MYKSLKVEIVLGGLRGVVGVEIMIGEPVVDRLELCAVEMLERCSPHRRMERSPPHSKYRLVRHFADSLVDEREAVAHAVEDPAPDQLLDSLRDLPVLEPGSLARQRGRDAHVPDVLLVACDLISAAGKGSFIG